jgi:hypothetical protein
MSISETFTPIIGDLQSCGKGLAVTLQDSKITLLTFILILVLASVKIIPVTKGNYAGFAIQISELSIRETMSVETTVPDTAIPEKSKYENTFLRTFLYSLGSAAGLFLYNTFNSFVSFFYTDAMGLPAQWVGRGLFAFGFWNA